MLDNPITVVINVFHTCKNTELKVYKFMSIQNQEEHIGHVKQSKVTDFRIAHFYIMQSTGLRPIYVMFFKFLPISFQMKNKDDMWL